MSVSELRPHPALRSSWGSRALWGAIVLFALLFAGLTIYRILSHDLNEVNAQRLEELSAASAAMPPPASPPGAEWPQWRGPNRDGVSTETGLLPTWPDEGPKVLWTQPTGDGYSSVVVARGRAITMVQDGEDEAVVCWDALTGVEQWRFKYQAHFRHRQFGDGPRSTPAIAGDCVYTVGGTGIMHCLRLSPPTARGESIWHKNLLEEFGGPQLEWGIAFSPLVENGLVHIMPGGSNGEALAALDANTGAVVWHNLDDSSSYSSPVPFAFAGERQVVYLTAERLVGLAAKGGEQLWAFPWPSGPAHTPSSITTPLVIHREVGDYVFVSGAYGKGCALVKIERDDNGFRASQVYKNLKLGTLFSSCVCQGDFIYGFNDVNLVCLDLRSGQRQWMQGGFDKGSLTLADGRLIILGADGTLAMAAADPKEYRELSRFQHSNYRPSWTVPVLAGGRLYVRDHKRLVCYDLRKSP
jgi:outer membrane protein assembly factor BamB